MIDEVDTIYQNEGEATVYLQQNNPLPPPVVNNWLTIDVGKQLRDSQKKQIEQLLDQYPMVFSKGPTDLRRTDFAEHTIELGNARPFKSQAYKISPAESTWLNQHLKELQDMGVISPSYSNYSSPVLIVKKKDGGFRMVVDLHCLNDVTIKDNYPLAKISDILDTIGPACYFSSLDAALGFYQVAMAPSDKKKTAFTTKFGNFEFNVMPFELMNAPATF